MKNRFKYNITCLCLLFIFPYLCVAQEVSEQKATDLAMRLFYESYPEKAPVTPFATNGYNDNVDTEVWQQDGINYMYIVNMPDSGWVLVANEERAVPILDISENGQFPAKEDL